MDEGTLVQDADIPSSEFLSLFDPVTNRSNILRNRLWMAEWAFSRGYLSNWGAWRNCSTISCRRYEGSAHVPNNWLKHGRLARFGLD